MCACKMWERESRTPEHRQRSVMYVWKKCKVEKHDVDLPSTSCAQQLQHLGVHLRQNLRKGRRFKPAVGVSSRRSVQSLKWDQSVYILSVEGTKLKRRQVEQEGLRYATKHGTESECMLALKHKAEQRCTVVVESRECRGHYMEKQESKH